MGALIGFVGSMGMLLFIGALLMAFLRYAGILSSANIIRFKHSCRIVFSVFAAYLGAACLMRGAVYGQSSIQFDYILSIFPSEGLRRTLDGLCQPDFSGVFSGIYLYLGHFLGEILLGKYLLGGVVLVFICLIASVFLILHFSEKIVGEENAKAFIILFFSMPGAYLLFLPGWQCLAFLVLSLLLFILLRRAKPLSIKCTSTTYTVLLVFCAVSSGALLFASVTGKLM